MAVTRAAPLCIGALALGALAFGGCLGDDGAGPRRADRAVLTIYASLPSRGFSADEAAAVEAGARYALRVARGRAGAFRVRLVRLDSTRDDDQTWDPAQVQANAERARDDASAIAYLGELDYGASAVSVPVTNEAGLLQVSPADGLTSLTRRPPGRASRGAPERYYPSEPRSFVRLIPPDLLEADLLADLLARLGARRVALVGGAGVYAAEMARQLAQRGRREGMDLVAAETMTDEPDVAAAVVARLRELDPDAILYAGVGDLSAAALLAELGRLLPATPVLAAGGLLARRPQAFASAPARVEVLSGVRTRARYPPAARRLLRVLRDERGAAVARPEALYGYEAVRLVLDAVAAVGARRGAVVREGLRPRARRSPLGRYRVRASGDVSEDRIAVYRLQSGRFHLRTVQRAEALR